MFAPTHLLCQFDPRELAVALLRASILAGHAHAGRLVLQRDIADPFSRRDESTMYVLRLLMACPPLPPPIEQSAVSRR